MPEPGCTVSISCLRLSKPRWAQSFWHRSHLKAKAWLSMTVTWKYVTRRMKVQRRMTTKAWMRLICRHHRHLWSQRSVSIISRAQIHCRKCFAALQLRERAFVSLGQVQQFRFIRKEVTRWVEVIQETILAQAHQTMTTAPMTMHQLHHRPPQHSWKVYLHKGPMTMSKATQNNRWQLQKRKLTEGSVQRLTMKWSSLCSPSTVFAWYQTRNMLFKPPNYFNRNNSLFGANLWIFLLSGSGENNNFQTGIFRKYLQESDTLKYLWLHWRIIHLGQQEQDYWLIVEISDFRCWHMWWLPVILSKY